MRSRPYKCESGSWSFYDGLVYDEEISSLAECHSANPILIECFKKVVERHEYIYDEYCEIQNSLE